MRTYRAYHLTTRALLVILCLALFATSINLAFTQRNAAYLVGVFGFAVGAYYAARDLRL